MERCDTCKHWGPPTSIDDAAAKVPCRRVKHRETIEQEAAALVPDQHDWDARDAAGAKALVEASAYVTDASGYHATLHTRGDFGCVLHEPKEA